MMNQEKIEIINFLQDFGCAKLEQLQILFNSPKNNFKSILTGNIISKKENIFIHNTKKIDNNMLIALDILCKYKGRFKQFYKGFYPIYVTFLSNDNLLYHIIVADNENKKGIVKLINSHSFTLPNADKLILAFPDNSEFENIKCNIPFLYCINSNLNIINN